MTSRETEKVEEVKPVRSVLVDDIELNAKRSAARRRIQEESHA